MRISKKLIALQIILGLIALVLLLVPLIHSWNQGGVAAVGEFIVKVVVLLLGFLFLLSSFVVWAWCTLLPGSEGVAGGSTEAVVR